MYESVLCLVVFFRSKRCDSVRMYAVLILVLCCFVVNRAELTSVTIDFRFCVMKLCYCLLFRCLKRLFWGGK